MICDNIFISKINRRQMDKRIEQLVKGLTYREKVPNFLHSNSEASVIVYYEIHI